MYIPEKMFFYNPKVRGKPSALKRVLLKTVGGGKLKFREEDFQMFL